MLADTAEEGLLDDDVVNGDDGENTKRIVEETQNDVPRVDVYEAPYVDPRSGREVVAQFHVEAKDNGVAVGQVFGGLVIGRRGGRDE